MGKDNMMWEIQHDDWHSCLNDLEISITTQDS